MGRKKRRTVILETVDDLVKNFLCDARKEDEDLPRGEIEDAIAFEEITPEEIVERFAKELRAGLALR